MKRAEKTIRIQINELTIDRLVFKKNEIKRTIEWMYMAGTFSKRKTDKLINILMHKYEEIQEEDLRRLNDAMEKDYQAMKKRLQN